MKLYVFFLFVFIPSVSISQNFTIVDGKSKKGYIKKNKNRSSITINAPNDIYIRTQNPIEIILKDSDNRTLKKLSVLASAKSYRIDLDYPLDRTNFFGRKSYYLSINNKDIDKEIIIKTTPKCGLGCKVGIVVGGVILVRYLKGSKNKKNQPLPEPPLPGGN